MAKCAALTGRKTTHQIVWVARCQNTAAHIIRGGIALCGTHFNAGMRGEIEVTTSIELTEGDLV